MSKRLFICADRHFPRGDAGANRILFMAKALLEHGWDIFVFSIGKNEAKYYNAENKCYVYEGVKYQNIVTAKQKTLRLIEHNFFDGYKIVKLLKEHKANCDDRILLYSSAYLFSKNICDFAKRNMIALACDIVEWHQPFQFRKGEKSLAYKLYHKFFYDLVPKTGNVVVISCFLEKHFKDLNCNTLVVPIYVDIDNLSESEKMVDEKIHLIYPGNPYRKDDLLSMLLALDMLKSEYREKVVFHLTGATIDHLKMCIPGKEALLEKLIEENMVLVHSWLEYSALISLYSKIDFALLARPNNIVTNANFPSKVPELLSKGIPVITNRVGDIVGYLNNGQDSILYDGEGAENCYTALSKIFQLSVEKRVAMRSAAIDTAKKQFNYHICGAALDSYFLQIKVK